MAKVSGTVTMGGKGVEGAGVVIQPDGGGTPALATTDASGNFTVDALVGPSKVSISKTEVIGGDVGAITTDEGVKLSGDTMSAKTKFLTPMKYGSTLTSGLILDVKQGMAPVTFDLK
jgi:hypothetical protein